MKKLVFWWNIPCKGIIDLLEDACSLESPYECHVITGGTGKHRKSMGWAEASALFPNHKIVSDEENWVESTTKLFETYTNAIHVFNGIDTLLFKHLIRQAQLQKIPHIFMSEAFSNLYTGYKKCLKSLYMRYILPFKIRPFAKHALGIISLSGKRDFEIEQFKRLGFSQDRIIPFGYWTNAAPIHILSDAEYIHMLCPGLLEKYKGVDILIRAIHKLKKRGNNTKFLCHITGKGSQLEFIKSLTRKLELEDCVVIHGVLSENQYEELLKKIDILVAPGRFEPWGIRINEAIQRGQAVVCSNGLGAAYLVQESRGGIVYESGNVTALETALETMLKEVNLQQAKSANLRYAPTISTKVMAHKLLAYIHYLYSGENINASMIPR